jgi:hypothetical protein
MNGQPVHIFQKRGDMVEPSGSHDDPGSGVLYTLQEMNELTWCTIQEAIGIIQSWEHMRNDQGFGL